MSKSLSQLRYKKKHCHALEHHFYLPFINTKLLDTENVLRKYLIKETIYINKTNTLRSTEFIGMNF